MLLEDAVAKAGGYKGPLVEVQYISSDAPLFTIGNSSHVGSSTFRFSRTRRACCRAVRNCEVGTWALGRFRGRGLDGTKDPSWGTVRIQGRHLADHLLRSLTFLSKISVAWKVAVGSRRLRNLNLWRNFLLRLWEELFCPRSLLHRRILTSCQIALVPCLEANVCCPVSGVSADRLCGLGIGKSDDDIRLIAHNWTTSQLTKINPPGS